MADGDIKLLLEKMHGGPQPLSPFYKSLYNAVNDPSLDSLISYVGQKRQEFHHFGSERVCICKVLARSVITGRVNLRMFYLDLKHYGFKRIRGSHHLEFGNANFKRGHPELLAEMQRNTLIKTSFKYAKRARAKLKARQAAEKAAQKAADCLQQLPI